MKKSTPLVKNMANIILFFSRGKLPYDSMILDILNKNKKKSIQNILYIKLYCV